MSISSQASVNSDVSHYTDKDLEKNIPTKIYSKEVTARDGSTKFDTRTVSSVLTSSGLNGQEVIILGNIKLFKNELLEALGLDEKSLQNLKGSTLSASKSYGNPGPLGLCAFAATTFMLSLCNSGVREVSVPNIVVGLSLFYGGIVQILAGMWEFACGSTFGALAFSSYGAFWLSYSAVLIDHFGIPAAYEFKQADLNNALGFYLLTWAIFTLLLLLCVLKTTLEFFMLFFNLFITFLLLSVNAFTGSKGCKVAGGVFGLLTAFIAWYNAFIQLTNKGNSYFVCPSVGLPNSHYKQQ